MWNQRTAPNVFRLFNVFEYSARRTAAAGYRTYLGIELGLKPERIQPPTASRSDDEVQHGNKLKLPQRFATKGHAQKPVRIEVNDEHFTTVAAGDHHTLVVTEYGDVYSCGRGKEGQLGHGEALRLDETELRKVDDLSKEMVTSVACGAFHSLAVTSSGRLFEWGLIHTHPASSINGSSDEQLMALAGPSRANTLANSRLNSVVADSARRWLAATDRDDVDGETSEEDEEPDAERALMQKIMLENLPQRGRASVPRPAISLFETRVVSVSAGYAHSVAVSEDGRAFSVGQNDRGQLGLGHRIHSGIFRRVVGMEACFVLEVACGEQHNIARALPTKESRSSGDGGAVLYVWGGGRLGQLGLGAASTCLAPTCNAFMTDVGGGVISVGAGANHSMCVVASGKVYGWGHAEYNQQGVAVVAGADLIRDQDGHSYFRVPRMVQGLAGQDIVSICCGSNFTLAVDRSGVTYSFGWNEGDALGRGWLGAYDPSPGPVASLPSVVKIAAGSRHTTSVTIEGPPVGRHLRSLIAGDDFADVELLAPDAARRGQPGVPVHMCIISVRCPYLAGHVKAALKSASGDGVGAQEWRENGSGSESQIPTAELCLEHATADTVSLLARYLYTDELATDASGKALGTLGRLAKELFLPRLEELCVARLPYSLRRRYNLQNTRVGNDMDSLPAVPPSTFVSELGRLAGSARHSDVLLVLDEWGWEFHCHKAVLCSAQWWRALLKGGFREGGTNKVNMFGLLQEGITRKEVLEAAVRHVYTNSSDPVVDMDPSSVMEVVILAEYMVLPSLVRACQRELMRYVDADSALYLFRFANRYCLLKLETLCREVLERSKSG